MKSARDHHGVEPLIVWWLFEALGRDPVELLKGLVESVLKFPCD